MTINMSRRQLVSPTIIADVAGALEASGLPARLLVLEVTETALVDDTDEIITVMHRVHELGVKLAIDGFGTRYSALTELHRMPVDVLKIDRALLARSARTQEECEVASAVVRLAASLGKRTLAKGVEERSQLAHLRSIGCEFGQGHLFAKPMPADNLTEHLFPQTVDVH